MPEARRHHPDLWQQARPPAAGKSAVQREPLVAPLGYRSESKPKSHSVLLATNSRNLWSSCMANKVNYTCAIINYLLIPLFMFNKIN
jgi:hypothetical protein